MSTIIASIVVLIGILAATSLFYFIPNAVLASIILVAVVGLIDMRAFGEAWRVSKRDFAVMSATFLSALFLGIDIGLLVGVLTSVLIILQRVAFPHVAELGILALPDGRKMYRNVKRFADAKALEGVVMLRVDAPWFFANDPILKEKLLRAGTRPGVHTVLLDGSGVDQLDLAAMHSLAEVQSTLNKRGVRLVLAQFIGPVRDAIAQYNAYREKHGKPLLVPMLPDLVRETAVLKKKEKTDAEASAKAEAAAGAPSKEHALEMGAGSFAATSSGHARPDLAFMTNTLDEAVEELQRRGAGLTEMEWRTSSAGQDEVADDVQELSTV